jgi:hypothetical protein
MGLHGMLQGYFTVYLYQGPEIEIIDAVFPSLVHYDCIMHGKYLVHRNVAITNFKKVNISFYTLLGLKRLESLCTYVYYLEICFIIKKETVSLFSLLIHSANVRVTEALTAFRRTTFQLLF